MWLTAIHAILDVSILSRHKKKYFKSQNDIDNATLAKEVATAVVLSMSRERDILYTQDT